MGIRMACACDANGFSFGRGGRVPAGGCFISMAISSLGGCGMG